MKALIFDVDGTLAETEDLHRKSFNTCFKEFALPWHWDRALYKKLLDVNGGRERLKHYAEISNFGPIDESAIHQRKTKIYTDSVLAGAIGLRPGVESMILRAKKAGLKLAIATTTSRNNVDSLLTATLGADVIGWFDVMSCGDEVSAKKPDPELYDLALRRLELSAGDCMAIEDSWLGLAAARAAGIPTIITPNPYTDHHDFPGALAIYPTLDVLLSEIDAGALPTKLAGFSQLA